MKKIKYYITALSLFNVLKNWYELPLMILGSKNIARLRNGLSFKIYDYLNILQLLEIFYKADYKIKLVNPKYIIDIGANIGDSTIYFANLYPRAKVFAFEPDKKIYKILLDNLKINNVKNVISYNFAVSDKSTKKTFYSYEFSGLSGFTKNNNRKSKSKEVNAVSLKTFLEKNKIKKVDLIKMDCEGAEYQILLKTQSQFISRARKYIVEYHDGLNDHSHNELVNLFKNFGYKVKVAPHKIENNIGIIRAYKK